MTAAIYTARGRAKTLIIGGYKWGGELMLTTQVENFPGFSKGILGPDLMLEMRKQAERFGAEFLEEDATQLNVKEYPFLVHTRHHQFLAKSLILATGAKAKWLGVPGEEKFKGRGVSVCAPCDAPFFKDQRVIVVGGGDSAMEETIVLSQYAREITIVHRRGEFKASKIMQERALSKPNVSVLFWHRVVEMRGEEKLEKVVLENTKTGERKEVAVDGVFLAIGHIPETELFRGQIELTEKGLIKAYELVKTSVPGVFGAGDVLDWNWEFRQAVTAAGSGCMAGLKALEFLREKGEL